MRDVFTRRRGWPWLTAALAWALAGCSVPVPVYSVAGKNVAALRSAPRPVRVGQFTGDQQTVSCRLRPIGPEGGGTFAAYIQNAFEEEATITGRRPAEGEVELRGVLRRVDVDCGIVEASWTIEMDMSIGEQPPFTVKTVRRFDGNYLGGVVFQRAYTAFVPSVQEFVHDVLASPAFQAAVAATR